ncbi:hypothetical protein CEXT_765391 [Caerostris extrusa]|uniref:Uncharacterized protein n=1 Tax=Caerostris extrusa TaxID=172846 RepID=A0AAV4M2P2_CAEEX|nr:hypothetical protein CEXT_765391 [Caerostris extrusa]
MSDSCKNILTLVQMRESSRFKCFQIIQFLLMEEKEEAKVEPFISPSGEIFPRVSVGDQLVSLSRTFRKNEQPLIRKRHELT